MTPGTRPPITPNPITQHTFRRSVWLQIYLPLILGGLLLAAALGGVVVAAGGGGFSAWADVSLIFLLLPALLLGLIAGAAVGALAYGVWWLVRESPPYFRLAQDVGQRVARQTRKIADRVVEPMLRAQAAQAQAKAARAAARSIWRR